MIFGAIGAVPNGIANHRAIHDWNSSRPVNFQFVIGSAVFGHKGGVEDAVNRLRQALVGLE